MRRQRRKDGSVAFAVSTHFFQNFHCGNLVFGDHVRSKSKGLDLTIFRNEVFNVFYRDRAPVAIGKQLETFVFDFRKVAVGVVDEQIGGILFDTAREKFPYDGKTTILVRTRTVDFRQEFLFRRQITVSEKDENVGSKARFDDGRKDLVIFFVELLFRVLYENDVGRSVEVVHTKTRSDLFYVVYPIENV